MQRDMFSYIKVIRGMSPKAAGTDNTAYVSEIANVVGFDSLTWITLIGNNTDTNATFTLLFEEGDQANLSDATAVADSDLIGTENGASFTFADDNKTSKIGYKGSKQYVRVTITPAGNDSGNIFISGAWILGHPRRTPQSSQLVA